MSGSNFKVVVVFEPREDGGVRAYSDDVPGLILSSKDVEGLLADIPNVISACLSHTLEAIVTVEPLIGVGEYLRNRNFLPVIPVAHGEREFVARVGQMIPRTLTRAQWEKKLRALGCNPLEGKGPLNTAEFWQDGTSYPFSVPADPATGDVDFWAFQRICKLLGAKIWENWQGDDC